MGVIKLINHVVEDGAWTEKSRVEKDFIYEERNMGLISNPSIESRAAEEKSQEHESETPGY